MKKKHLFLLLALAASLAVKAQNAGDLTQFLPSNWGGWQNLTYGVADATQWSNNHMPMEIQISGSTIHVAWMEQVKQNDGMYPLYYRRSLDNGKTWEAARIIARTESTQWTSSSTGDAAAGNNSHWMTVEGKNVHFALCFDSNDGKHTFNYYRSTDGGATFSSQQLWETTTSWIKASRPHVACDGQTVVVAANVDANKPYVWTSFDGGTTFKLAQINESYKLADLQVSGKRWTILGSLDSGQAYDRWSRVFFSTSTDGGETVSTENLAYAASNGKTYSTSNCLNNPSYAYHPQMVQQGDIIDLMYEGSLSDGNEGDPDPGYDYNHTIHRRSTDGGKTWNKAQYLPESTGSDGTIAAKGDNIYILTTRNSMHGIYHSHDGGKSWAFQEQCVTDGGRGNTDTYNASTAYQLYIAPDDATGQHVFLTSKRAYFVESKDGFRTICRNFNMSSEAWDRRDWNNNSLYVQLDHQGTEHWFMLYSAPYQPFQSYFWNICYRRNDPVEKTGSTNMALELTNNRNEWDNLIPSHQLTVPMTTNLHEIKKAMTVECWVRPDTISSFQIASLTNEAGYSEGSIYRGGWSLGVAGDHDYHYTFSGTMTTELSTDGVGTGISSGYYGRYRIYDTGYWHHVAMTYDASVEKNNLRLYVDGMLLTFATVKGDILQGNNPIVIGGANGYSTSNALVDNFAVWDRALSQEELRNHIYQAPTGKEQGCRLMLTFDGSLQDQSNYHNDGIALKDLMLTPHDGIRAPHPQFIASKDPTGRYVNLTDATSDGEVCWWVKPYPWYIADGKSYYVDAYQTSTKRNERIDFGQYHGNYHVNMIVRPTGNCNAYASAEQKIVIEGLNRVYPETAGQAEGVNLKIEGGYTLTYSNQPRVALHGANGDIEGKWQVEYGYDSRNVAPEDIASAQFDLSSAVIGTYDVIVGTDTLYQAFTLEKGEEPDVWLQVNGRGASLWNKYQRYTIDYGNNSNVAAYNVPMFLVIPDRKGTMDVAFDFEFDLCNYALSDYGLEVSKQLGEYVMAYDEKTGDSIRVYSFMIPYIGPNSTYQRSFRIRMKYDETISNDEITMGYWLEEPWGAYDPDAPNPYESVSSKAPRRAPYTMEQGECVAGQLGKALLETAVGAIPGVGCMYSMGKTAYQAVSEKEKPWSTFFSNSISTFFSCAGDLIPGGKLATAAFTLGSLAWSVYSTGNDINGCLGGGSKSIKNRGRRSWDPNEMIGPWGQDEYLHYIKPIHQMNYTVTFENKSSATAPANEVFVTDTLDAKKYDLSTFTFNSYGWADTTIVVGGGRTQQFSRDVKYQVNGHDILVRVSGQFDTEKGIARWAFVSLEKNGDELEDIMNGFLKPNNDNGVGEGFVSFSIEHKKNPATGSTVSNKATIIFDANEPIVTNTYVNTFDTDYPTSKISSASYSNGSLNLTIEGNDGTSGIDYYDIYIFENDSETPTVESKVAGPKVSIPCKPDTKYGLCVIATDRVGWSEPKDVKVERVINTSASASGDINGDGEVNVTDVVTLINYIARNDFSGVDKNSLDMNGDGEVNVTDVVTLILMIGKG